MSEKSLSDRIIDGLPEKKGQSPFRDLFTIADTARAFNTSYRTAARAIAEMKRRGIVESIQGKGIRLAGVSEKPCGGGATSARVLASRIDDRIRRGEYRAGAPLPKSAFLSVSENCSTVTVVRAMRILAARSRIYKSGKRWIAGAFPGRRSIAAGRYRDGRTVVIHLPGSLNMWFRIADQIFVTPFYRTLISNLQSYGVGRAVVCHMPHDSPHPCAAGWDEIQRTVHQLGDRYAGVLIHRSRHLDWYKPVIEWYGRRKKPVVLFDAIGWQQEQALTRRTVSCRGPFFRCIRNEIGAQELTAKSLVEMGHRRIGIMRIMADWDQPRYSALADALGRRAGGIEIFSAHQHPNEMPVPVVPRFFGESPWYTPQGIIDRIHNKIQSQAGDAANRILHNPMRERLRESMPSVASLLKKQITVVVAWNDFNALRYYYWLHCSGVRFPADLSLISYDNELALSVLPVSTVDFGLERLGYLAAHIFIHDFPVKADDRWGNIASVPTLENRGSLGPPRKGTLRF